MIAATAYQHIAMRLLAIEPRTALSDNRLKLIGAGLIGGEA